MEQWRQVLRRYDNDELNEDFIDELMADAQDQTQESDHEEARGELLTRQSYTETYVSRKLFERAKKVGKKVVF